MMDRTTLNLLIALPVPGKKLKQIVFEYKGLDDLKQYLEAFV